MRNKVSGYNVKISFVLLLSLVFIFSGGCGSNLEDNDSLPAGENIDDDISGVHQEDSREPAGEELTEVLELFPDSEFIFAEETEKVRIYLEQAEQRKEEILNSETTIRKAEEFIPGKTYTGTAYYVSPDGSNDHDGLSPQTAWREAGRVTEGFYTGLFEAGDAVFFERGGVYRLTEGPMMVSDHVTYSAYGEGRKPVITLAQEDSAVPAFWELYHEGEEGQKIWKYQKDITQAGGIVFNDGESYARRVLEWPSEEGWQAIDIVEMDPVNGITADTDPTAKYAVKGTGEYRLIEENMEEDNSFLWRSDYRPEYPIEFCCDTDIGRCYSGELYLRCDSGNPGEVYREIEIIAAAPDQDSDLIQGWEREGYVLDNLCLKYYLDNAVQGSLTGRGIVIQNCAVEWGGERLSTIASGEPENDYMLIGDGIYCVAADAVICNNYMLHSGNGCTFENSMEALPDMGTYTCTGNLMEYCDQGVRIGLGDNETAKFQSITVKDNMILYCGEGMNNGCWEEPAAIDAGWDPVQYAEQMSVLDNVLIHSAMVMVKRPDPKIVKIDFSHNTYIQSEQGMLATVFGEYEGGILWLSMPAPVED